MILPEMMIYAYNYINGDGEEYENLPDYQRDLFFNIKISGTDTWVSIPKPFEQALVSAFVSRLLSYSDGNKEAFSGFMGSASSALIPVEDGSVMGPLKPALEVMNNKDTFRNKYIVPPYEYGLSMEYRKGYDNGSRIGKMISRFSGLDPRQADHLVRGYTGNFGDWALTLSNIGVEDKYNRFKIDHTKTGFSKKTPIINSKVVQDIYTLERELGNNISSKNKEMLENYKKVIEYYYQIENPERKDEVGKLILKAGNFVKKGLQYNSDVYNGASSEFKEFYRKHKHMFN